MLWGIVTSLSDSHVQHLGESRFFFFFDWEVLGNLEVSQIDRFFFKGLFIFTPTWNDDPIWRMNNFQMGWNHELE